MSSLISKAISFSLWPSALKTIPFSREVVLWLSLARGGLGSGIGRSLYDRRGEYACRENGGLAHPRQVDCREILVSPMGSGRPDSRLGRLDRPGERVLHRRIESIEIELGPRSDTQGDQLRNDVSIG